MILFQMINLVEEATRDLVLRPKASDIATVRISTNELLVDLAHEITADLQQML